MLSQCYFCREINLKETSEFRADGCKQASEIRIITLKAGFILRVKEVQLLFFRCVSLINDSEPRVDDVMENRWVGAGCWPTARRPFNELSHSICLWSSTLSLAASPLPFSGRESVCGVMVSEFRALCLHAGTPLFHRADRKAERGRGPADRTTTARRRLIDQDAERH